MAGADRRLTGALTVGITHVIYQFEPRYFRRAGEDVKMLRPTVTLAGLLAASVVAMAAQAAPAPGGHDLILRRLIQDAAQGKIDYQTLTPDLAAAVRPQSAVAQSELTALGALRTVTFESVNQAGSEIYRTDFERGALDWAFSINAQGLIANAIYRPATAGPS
jgi:hypothetical protein